MDRHFVRARRRTCEEESGHIRARQQQDDRDDPHQYRKRGSTSAADRALMIWSHDRSNVAIRRRILIRQGTGDPAQLADGLLDIDARSEPAEDAQVADVAAGERPVRQQRQGLP
jgi:hypothetical protein